MALSTPTEVQTGIDLAPWVEIISARFGLQFGPTRIRRLEQGLRTRIRATRLPTQTYLDQIRHNPQAEEWQNLISELVIGETRFFRHQPSFQLLSDMLIPERISAVTTAQTTECKILSAGCSNGAEAYSLAMCALPLCRDSRVKLSVVGLDICAKAIAFATRGHYPERAMRGLDSKRKARFFRSQNDGKTFEVGDDLKECSTFRQENLHQPSDLGGPYDVIFCQNLFIYLSKPDRQHMIRRLVNALKPFGYLILGPAEVFQAQDTRLDKLDFEQTLVFQRKPSPGNSSMREFS